MSNGVALFQDLMDATHPPQANPYYGAQQITPDEYAEHAPKGTNIPKSSIWLDAHGNDITSHMSGLSSDQTAKMTSTPYQQPSFWARLGRTGQETASLNAQAQNLLGQQLQQRSARRASTLADQMTLPNNLTSPFGSQQTMATLTGGDSTAVGIQNALTSLGNINKNLPAIASTANVNNALASGAQGLNTATTANELYNLNQPVTQAQAENQGTQNQLASSTAAAPNIAPAARLAGQQISGSLAAQPDINTAMANQAKIGASTSGTGVDNLPFINDASRANAIMEDWQAKHPNIPFNSLAGSVDTGNNTFQPGRNLMNTIMGSAMGQLQGGTPQTFSSGSSYVKPTLGNAAINPLINPSSNILPPTGGGADGSWEPDNQTQVYQNNQPADHVKEAEQTMLSMGLIHEDELYNGKTGRDKRRITDSQEESLIKSRLPLLLKYAQNPRVRPGQRLAIAKLNDQFGK